MKYKVLKEITGPPDNRLYKPGEIITFKDGFCVLKMEECTWRNDGRNYLFYGSDADKYPALLEKILDEEVCPKYGSIKACEQKSFHGDFHNHALKEEDPEVSLEQAYRMAENARTAKRAREHRRCCGGNDVNCQFDHPNLAQKILKVLDYKLDSHASPNFPNYGPLLIDSIVEVLENITLFKL